jgi:hypothetical protein
VSKRKALGIDPLSWIKPTTNVDAGESHQPSSQTQPSYEEIQEMQETVKGKTHEEEKVPLPSTHYGNRNLHNNLERKNKIRIPKFQTYEIKLTIRLKEDQLQFLSRLEREIMKNRSRPNRKERITKNSIIRAIIDTFQDLSIDTNEIGDEDMLLKKLKRAVQISESKVTKA